MAEKVVVRGAARTPFGRYGGALASLGAPEPGGATIREAMDRSVIAAEEMGHSVFGIVVQVAGRDFGGRRSERR